MPYKAKNINIFLQDVEVINEYYTKFLFLRFMASEMNKFYYYNVRHVFNYVV